MAADEATGDGEDGRATRKAGTPLAPDVKFSMAALANTGAVCCLERTVTSLPAGRMC